MFTEDKDNVGPQPEEAPDKGSSAAMEDMHIPDYVMLDFGFLEGRGTSGRPWYRSWRGFHYQTTRSLRRHRNLRNTRSSWC